MTFISGEFGINKKLKFEIIDFFEFKMTHETFILSKKHIFLSTTIRLPEHLQREFDYIKKNFCGLVLPTIDLDQIKRGAWIYLTGDISQHAVPSDHKIFIVRQFSTNFDESDTRVIDMGAVPVNIHGLGVYLRNFLKIL